MKIILSVLLLLGATFAAHAAITVTIMPGVSGTTFNVTQTAPNPLISLDPATGGFVFGIAIAPEAFDQDISAIGFVDIFSAPLGSLTNLFGGVPSDLVGFSFFEDTNSGLYRPSLNLASFITLGSNQSHQIQLTSGMTSEVGIDFTRFVLGTHVISDPIFGEVTTVVIPEPGSILLASIGCGLLLSRRHRALIR